MQQIKNYTEKEKAAIGGYMAGVIIFLWILIGTLLFHYLEDWTYAQSFYYSITTLTTVGYGDFVPTTDFNRVITALYMLIGITITFGAFGYIGSNYMAHKEQIAMKRSKKRQISKK